MSPQHDYQPAKPRPCSTIATQTTERLSQRKPIATAPQAGQQIRCLTQPVRSARGLSGSGRPSTVTPTWPASGPPLRGAKTGTNHARPASRPPAQPGACARHGDQQQWFATTKKYKLVRKERGCRALNGVWETLGRMLRHERHRRWRAASACLKFRLNRPR